MENEEKKQIEKLSWNVFLNETGFRFTRELTDEEKQKIFDTPQFDFYKDKAEKLYQKKQRSLQNKKYPVITVPSSGKRGWAGGAYTLCFVYSKYNGNFVLKGYIDEVEEYLKKNYTHYFYNKSLWHQGINRDIWGFWKKGVGIFEPSLREKRKGKKIEVRPYGHWRDSDEITEEKDKKALRFKRLPKRWIPEFDEL